MDQRLLSGVQRIGDDDEPRPKPLEDVDEAGGSRSPYLSMKTSTCPAYRSCRSLRILPGHRKSAGQRALPPPPRVEGRQLIDHEPRVLDRATVQDIALPAAAQILEQEDDALLRLVRGRVVHPRREPGRISR